MKASIASLQGVLLAVALVPASALILAEPAFQPPVLLAHPFDDVPMLDGNLNDAAWRAPRLLTVNARGVTPQTKGLVSEVGLRAGFTESHIYLTVTWPDDRPDSSGHQTWVWDPARNRYVEGDDREDMLGVAFEHTGPLVANMLAGMDGSWDVWQWMAYRTNPQGFAMDRMHIFSSKPRSRDSQQYTADHGGPTWITRPEDAGQRVVVERPAPPAFVGERVPRFMPGVPDHSAADVRAKGAWTNAKWTVEFSRRLDTGHPDDAVLNPSRTYRMAVSLHNRASGMDRASGVVVLRFGRRTKP